jgi:hypothetical protein
MLNKKVIFNIEIKTSTLASTYRAIWGFEKVSSFFGKNEIICKVLNLSCSLLLTGYILGK